MTAVCCQEPSQSGRREPWPSEVVWERVLLGMTCIGGRSTPHSEPGTGILLYLVIEVWAASHITRTASWICLYCTTPSSSY